MQKYQYYCEVKKGIDEEEGTLMKFATYREIEKKLGISMMTIQRLLEEPERSQYRNRFKLWREKVPANQKINQKI